MSNLLSGFIRSSSFLRKEIFEILRQPRLVATLVVGPFLILYIFGIGYQNQVRSLRTLFVAQANSAIPAQDIEQYGQTMGRQISFAGVTGDLNQALDQLRQGQVDLVIVVPVNAMDTIDKNRQAVFTFYHHEIDPAQVSYVEYVGWLYVEEVNRQVLTTFAVQGQKDSVTLHNNLQEAHQNVLAMRQAMQSGNATLAQQKQQGSTSAVNAVSVAVGNSLGYLDNLQETKDPDGAASDSVPVILADLRQNTNQLNSTPTASQNEKLAHLDKMDKDLTKLDGQLSAFQNIDPSIIVNPFTSQVKSIASVQLTPLDFFAPAVLALLLQHLAVTFAALSVVRERNAGTMDLFRVSPLSASEALFGKYVSYLLFGGVIAAILSALLVFVLHVPLLGDWWYFALVIAAVLFTSLGIGFAISIVSQTDSQAVQYSMIVLLASVFFSGFIMNLDTLLKPVQIISWLLPTTYGTLLLRDIALRGISPDWGLLGGLIAIGLVLMLISWLLMRRLIASMH